MRQYHCNCGNTVFYENSQCLACGSELGYCPACHEIVALIAQPDGSLHCGNAACGVALVKCSNYLEHNVCNRCLVADDAAAGTLCDCCRFNATIPDLSIPANVEKWRRLERAKRRLFYDLNLLGLPYGTVVDPVDPPLSFDFKADVIAPRSFWRRVGRTEQVFTGHAAGLITINIREADDVIREKLRVDFGEAQRTLIGHFRHEVGHYYWDQLVKGRREEESRAVFGDHDSPTYGEALENYYTNGAAPDWATRCVSAYATMHPWEDFAETWATYLDMVSTLDTAAHVGIGGVTNPLETPLEEMVKRYQELGIALNELNRSVGLLDAVPEVLVPPVVEKLKFIHHLVQLGREENGVLGGQPVAAPAAEVTV